jgi:serine/threonine-protein kinase
MELLEGQSLAEWLEHRGVMTLDQVTTVLDQTAKALTKAHERGVVHRDLKPENLFHVEGGYELFVKVLDFGIAKQGESLTLTSEWEVAGTPEFMSPEQFASTKNVDHRTDLWAMGVVAYELLSGKVPFSANDLIEFLRVVTIGQFMPISRQVAGIGPAIDAWFAKALAVDRDSRFQSATEMANAFRAAVARQPKVPQPVATGSGTIVTHPTAVPSTWPAGPVTQPQPPGAHPSHARPSQPHHQHPSHPSQQHPAQHRPSHPSRQHPHGHAPHPSQQPWVRAATTPLPTERPPVKAVRLTRSVPRRTLAANAPPPPPVEAVQTRSGSTLGPTTTRTFAAKPSRAALWLGIGAAASLVIAAGGWWFVGRHTGGASEPPVSDAPTQAPTEVVAHTTASDPTPAPSAPGPVASAPPSASTPSITSTSPSPTKPATAAPPPRPQPAPPAPPPPPQDPPPRSANCSGNNAYVMNEPGDLVIRPECIR